MEEATTSGSGEQNLPESISEVKEKEEWQKKSDLTNALKHCKKLLEAKNLLTNSPVDEMSAASIAMGEEIFKEIIFMLEDRQIIIDENLITADEIITDNDEEYEKVRSELFVNIFDILCLIL